MDSMLAVELYQLFARPDALGNFFKLRVDIVAVPLDAIDDLGFFLSSVDIDHLTSLPLTMILNFSPSNRSSALRVVIVSTDKRFADSCGTTEFDSSL